MLCNPRSKWLLCLEEWIGPSVSPTLLTEVTNHFPEEYQRAVKFFWDYARNKDFSEILFLTEEECLCVILYTSSLTVYKQVNAWLRGLDEGKEDRGVHSHFVSTLYYALVKLSQHQKQPLGVLYRGVPFTATPDGPLASFLATDASGFQGGGWYTFTPCYRSVHQLKKSTRTIFEVVEREEDEGGIHRAVLIPECLNMFASEGEFVFPPLTVLQVKRVYVENDVTRIVVDPIYRSNVRLPLLSPTEEIWNAVLKDEVVNLKKWLDSNVSVNLESIHQQHGCCLLYSVARYGRLEMVKALIEGCAFIDTQASSARSTPLHAACYFGFPKVVDYLLAQGANPQIKNAYSLKPEDDLLENKELSRDMKNQLVGKFKALPTKINEVVEVKMAVTYLVYGDRLSYLEGISQILGSTSLTMEQEFMRGIIFNERYAGTVNTKELWAKANSELTRLQKHVNAEGLTDNEILAAFLYTTPAYKIVNDYLRDLIPSKNRYELLSPSKSWVATISHINSAIRKLSKLTTTNFPTVWRGVTMPLNPEFFVPDKRGLICATEYGFMSTSLKKKNAISFALGGNNKQSTIFCVKCRAEDPGGFHMGASLKWCSAVPPEEEVLFPPLTLFELLKRERKDLITTITVAPTFI